MRSTWLHIFFFCAFALVAAGQELHLESLLDGLEEEIDQAALMDYLEHLAENPLDINSASIQELASLPWITPLDAAHIVERRVTQGPFRELEELRSIRGLGEVYETIAPFLTVRRSRKMQIQIHGRHRVQTKIEAARGYRDAIYSGSRQKVYNRIRAEIGGVRLGYLAEKDPGEADLDDFSAAHFTWQNSKLGTRVIVGHFGAEFGQGLTTWGPYRLGKSSDPISSIAQQGRGLYSFLSTSENWAFQGIAVSAELKKLCLYLFTSRAHRDARLEQDLVKSLPLAGLHRTPGEREIAERLLEKANGGALIYHFSERACIGLSTVQTKYSYPFAPAKGFDVAILSGQSNRVTSLFGSVTKGRYHLFGEHARSGNGKGSSIIGLVADLDAIRMAVLWRRFDPEFQNPHAMTFGENNDATNERGLYWGLNWRPDKSTTLSFYSDIYTHPWPELTLGQSVTGQDILGLYKKSLGDRIALQLRLRSRAKATSLNTEDQFGNSKKINSQSRTTTFRVQLNIRATASLEVKSRLEFSSFKDAEMKIPAENRSGILLRNNLVWRHRNRLKLYACWSLFDSPLYELRFYQYENDLPGVMRIKMLAGRGTRWYGMFVYSPLRSLRCSLKYEVTRYDDRDSIGSGYDKIERASEHAIAVQLDWQI